MLIPNIQVRTISVQRAQIYTTCIYMHYLRSLKFTLKHLKRSYMFRAHDHPQGAHIVPC